MAGARRTPGRTSTGGEVLYIVRQPQPLPLCLRCSELRDGLGCTVVSPCYAVTCGEVSYQVCAYFFIICLPSRFPVSLCATVSTGDSTTTTTRRCCKVSRTGLTEHSSTTVLLSLHRHCCGESRSRRVSPVSEARDAYCSPVLQLRSFEGGPGLRPLHAPVFSQIHLQRSLEKSESVELSPLVAFLARLHGHGWFFVLVFPYGDLAYMFAQPEHMSASFVRISGFVDTANRSPDIVFDAVSFGDRRVCSRS